MQTTMHKKRFINFKWLPVVPTYPLVGIKPTVVRLFSLFSFLIFVDEFYFKKKVKFKFVIKLKKKILLFLECLSPLF